MSSSPFFLSFSFRYAPVTSGSEAASVVYEGRSRQDKVPSLFFSLLCLPAHSLRYVHASRYQALSNGPRRRRGRTIPFLLSSPLPSSFSRHVSAGRPLDRQKSASRGTLRKKFGLPFPFSPPFALPGSEAVGDSVTEYQRRRRK